MLQPLAVSALSFLSERPMHPYEMFQLMLTRREDRIVKVNAGTLYRTIEKLASLGLAEPVGTEREGNRPERTTYRITEAGREQLEERVAEMLETPAVEYPEVYLALSEMHWLPAERVADLLSARCDELEAEIHAIDASIAAVKAREVPERWWLDVPFRRAMTVAHLEWIRSLIPRIRSGDVDWETMPTFRYAPSSPHTASHIASHSASQEGIRS